jgi:predicted nucleotidyltransferase
MIDPQTVQKAIGILLSAAPKGSKVILFGSYARGQAQEHSDLDFLVVEPQVNGRIQEAARLDRALRGVRVSLDVLVVSQAAFEEWKDTPNTAIYAAAREGKVFSEVA